MWQPAHTAHVRPGHMKTDKKTISKEGLGAADQGPNVPEKSPVMLQLELATFPSSPRLCP